jgi:amino acid permease
VKETSDHLQISREELLGGLPARRASTLLFAIESRTAQLVSKAKQATALYLTPKAAEEREREFLEAIAAGRDLPIQPTIQDLERYAPHWASLVPDDSGVRAAVARMLGNKYRFADQDVPQLQFALGLNDSAVLQAFRRLYSEPLESIYTPRISISERLRWGWTAISERLESLPPFWIAFALTLPGAAGLVALPIALAGVGFVTGIILLVVFGLINMLTVAALAEAVARSGVTRFGLGFLGQLAGEYLGNAGSVFMTVTLAANNFFVLIIFYIGVAGTLEDATRVPAELWIAALFGVCLFFLSRKSLNATVATTLIIVLINIIVLLTIPFLALPHFQPVNLTLGGLPFVGGGSFEPATWQLVLGILLSTYFSHMLVATYGQVILSRDPGARSWIRGSVTAIFAFMLIACLWLVAVNGAVPAEVLSSTAGTVLSPLAEEVGPVIHLLGSLLIVLSLGLASVQIALGLYYLVQERMPSRSGDSPVSKLTERSRFLLSMGPVVGVFLLAEWVAITGLGTFTGLLGVLSALALPLLGGTFPVLLLAATRRKGDFVPEVVSRLLGNPFILAVVFLFFLISIFIHGLFLFESPLTRILTLVIGSVVLAITIVMLRRGALERRVVVALVEDQHLSGQDTFHITDSGRPATATIQFHYSDRMQQFQAGRGEVQNFSQLRHVTIRLPAPSANQLKVWVHRITPEGLSEGVPAQLGICSGKAKKTMNLNNSAGMTTLPLDGEGRLEVEISFPGEGE